METTEESNGDQNLEALHDGYEDKLKQFGTQ